VPALELIKPPIQRVTVALLLAVKRPERQADHSPPSSAEVKNAWSYASCPQYTIMTWFKAQGKLYRYPFDNK
jgi:hypothetical protein